MRQERIEAAAQALNNSYSFKWTRLPWPELVKSSDNANQNRVRLDREYAANALAAGDEVMFSDEALARAGWELYKRAYPEHAAESLEQVGAPIRNSYMQHVRIVVAALKGDA